jgi:hypothetical protein
MRANMHTAVQDPKLKAAYEQQARLADALSSLILDVRASLAPALADDLINKALEHLKHPEPVGIDADHVDLIGLEA